MGLYIVVTVPFHNARQRAIHFVRHGHEFGAANEFDYESMAEAFMASPMHPNMHEGTRTTGTRDRIRLDAF
jgi:pyocin large subunit-like protein